MRDQANEKKGMEKGILGMVSALRDLNIPDDTILEKLQEKFMLTIEEAMEYLNH